MTEIIGPLPRRRRDNTIMRQRSGHSFASVRKVPAYAVIIRAISTRGEEQDEAVAELARRGLWLAAEQKRQAGLA